MGIDYYLANKKDKLIYELGRGGQWYTIFDNHKYSDSDKIYFLYRNTFVDYFKRVMIDVHDGSKILPEDLNYWDELANELFDFFDGVDPENDLLLVNDSDDSLFKLEQAGYIIIASRYKSDAYDTYIRALNSRKNISLFTEIDLSLPISRIRKLLPFM